MQFGRLRLDLVRGPEFRLDGGAMFGVVPKVLWERQSPADERNRVRLATNCLLVRGEGFVALVESGLGGKWDAKERDRYAIEETTIDGGLRDLGVQPADVDALVLSHLHFDHAGGATRLDTDGSAVPAFGNATLYVQEEELAHARNPNERDRGSYRPDDWEPYARAGRIEAVRGEVEVRPGVTVVPVRGHNAGMQAIRVESEGNVAFYFADALPTTAHVPIAWIMAYDLYPVDLIENKRRLVARAVAEGWLCVFEHDPQIPWGRIVGGSDGERRVEPAAR